MKRVLRLQTSGFRLKYKMCRTRPGLCLFDIGKRELSEGFTMIELTIGMGIFVMLLLAVTGMMMTAFRTDSQTKAFEEVQIANLAIVNDLIQTARFSLEGNIINNGVVDRLEIITKIAPLETVTYYVDADGRFKRQDSATGTDDYLTSPKLIVEKFDVINKADSGGVELFLVKIKLVDTLGEMKDAKEKQIMLSIRR